jgi:hypothetical protein
MASERAVVAAEASAREAIAREELARQEAAATRASETSRAEELATLARKCDALHEARVAAESREQSARKALEAQHARHLEQLRRVFLTLVPIRPRSRGELHSLRTFSPGGRFSPPTTTRFQSRRAALDAFQLRL